MRHVVRKRGGFLFLMAALLGLAACATGSSDPQGSYQLVGETAEGTAYDGAAMLTPSGINVLVDWTRPGQLDRAGFALQKDDVLGVATTAQQSDYAGIVLYRVEGGKLSGTWAGKGDSAVRRYAYEDLEGSPTLEGRYQITRGENPGGRPATYYGQVEIRKKGAVYEVDWSTPVPSYVGTGVLLGNIFVVAYDLKTRPGVAAYCLISSDLAEGITVRAGETATGAEILWRGDRAAPADAAARLQQLREQHRAPQCGGAPAS